MAINNPSKSFVAVLDDVEDTLINKPLNSLSGQGYAFTVVSVDRLNEQIHIRLDKSPSKMDRVPFKSLQAFWNILQERLVVSVDEATRGNGSARSRPQTILAHLPYIEHLKIENRQYIAYVGENTHQAGTTKEMMEGTQRHEEYSRRVNIPIKSDLDELLGSPKEDVEALLTADFATGGKNILLYGVPGSGKSHAVRRDYCDDADHMETVVFHPDYSYSDFVGQVLPQVNGENITYRYIPGPFTRLLAKAYRSPRTRFFLVIEEINRGNAPAIFGDVLQLLDRDSNGKSKYSISNPDIASCAYGIQNDQPVFLPSNMSIVATMNTSDQNVFSLDTAFQRRWHIRLIPNDIKAAPHASNKILDTSVT